MNGWNRGDVLALIGIIIAVLIFIAQEILKGRGFSLSQNVVIEEPRNKEVIEAIYGEKYTIKRKIIGRITGYTQKQIESLGLYVEVFIYTDTWYQQGQSSVQRDKKWMVIGRFGAINHVIKAELKDKHGVVLKKSEIEVIVKR